MHLSFPPAVPVWWERAALCVVRTGLVSLKTSGCEGSTTSLGADHSSLYFQGDSIFLFVQVIYFPPANSDTVGLIGTTVYFMLAALCFNAAPSVVPQPLLCWH